MATLSIGKAHINISAHYGQHTDSVAGKEDGFLTRLSQFASSAQKTADKYADYKYNQTEWMMFRL